MRFLNQIKDDFLNVLFPETCAGCGTILFKQENLICLKCKLLLPKTQFKNNSENFLEKLFWGRLPIEFANSFLYFKKQGLTQQLIHQLKYKNNKEVGIYLGKLFAKDILEDLSKNPPDVITTVPLHPKKLKLRGYNQSDEIAKGISEVSEINFLPNIINRKIFTKTQTKEKKYNRWLNTEDVFEIKQPELIENKHICIVDDVITTGATIESCGQEILKYSNTKVSFLSLCITNS